jgi:hypothetical protein
MERDARNLPVIWGRDQGKYFLREDWTTQIRLNRLGKLFFGAAPTLNKITSIARTFGSVNNVFPDAYRTEPSSHVRVFKAKRRSQVSWLSVPVCLCVPGDATGFCSQMIQVFALRLYHHTVVHQRLHTDNFDHEIAFPARLSGTTFNVCTLWGQPPPRFIGPRGRHVERGRNTGIIRATPQGAGLPRTSPRTRTSDRVLDIP